MRVARQLTTGRFGLAPVAILLLAGCVAAPAGDSGAAVTAPSASPLGGTQWQLVAIESMSDEQPTLRPVQPALYAIAFGTNGRAHLRLDCNRGMADWSATNAPGDSPGRVSGQLAFGQMAVTRAQCAPGSLAPRLAASIPYVRGFLIVDGRLHMSLLADGGILQWTPAGGDPGRPARGTPP